MRVIINGKIREDKKFRTSQNEYVDKYGRHFYDTYFIGDVQIHDNKDGTFHLDIDNITGSIPEQVPQEMIVGFSIMSGLSGIPRARGIYKLGGAVAVVERTGDGIVDVSGTSLEDVRNLYRNIRAGSILPEPKDNWDAQQIKPSFWQRLNQVFLR